MAARRFHSRILRHAWLALALTIASTLASAAPAEAHNTWNGGFRKWPWRAGTEIALTTLPGECPHCSGKESSSAWKAIDAAMYYDTVYSLSPGTVDAYVVSGGGAGTYLRVENPDGTYLTYEHLSKVLVSKGAVVPGQPIATSGETGNVTGPHLHFQRQSGTSFGSTALDLVPISGHGGSGDPLTHGGYTSDNAGIGLSSASDASTTMQALYASQGGYSGAGVSANVGSGWSPCNAEGASGTWWRYGCAPRSGVAGSVQTFFVGSSNRPRALMHQSGASASYALYRAILGAYTEVDDGHDWSYWLGYPQGNRYPLANRSAYRQDFQYGWVVFAPSSCVESMYVGGALRRQYEFCD